LLIGALRNRRSSIAADAAMDMAKKEGSGQKFGIKEVGDGIWLVSFMHYDLG